MSRNLVTIMLLAALIAFACTASNSQSPQGKTNQPDEAKAPPLKYTLKIGKKSIAITEGETVSIKGRFRNPKVTLTAQPHRLFSYRGVSFKYPRSFTFEAELEESDFQSWTLSGNDFTIMFFVIADDLTAEEYARELMSDFGRENCAISKAVPFEFGSQKISGTKLEVNVVGNKTVTNAYRISTDNMQTKLLIFQDFLDDDGNPSREGKSTLDIVQRSFKLKK